MRLIGLAASFTRTTSTRSATGCALGHPDIDLDVRAAASRIDRLPFLAAEPVGRNVEVIVTDGGPAAVAAKQATATIPIVIGTTAADLVQIGLVASLARPGSQRSLRS